MNMMMSRMVTIPALRRAIEDNDINLFKSLYDDDAVLRIVDKQHPPSHPLEFVGRNAIEHYLEDVCSKVMTHRLEQPVVQENHLAFTETSEYPDGTRVLCMTALELDAGKIKRQTNVQVWDE